NVPATASCNCTSRVLFQLGPVATASILPSGEQAAAETVGVAGSRYATSPSGTLNTGIPLTTLGRPGSSVPCEVVTVARSPRGETTTRLNPVRVSERVVS